MSTIIDLRAYLEVRVAPTLVLIDMQRDQLAVPRGPQAQAAEQVLANCRSALSFARMQGIPVAFVRSAQSVPFHHRLRRGGRWIEGFEPTRLDMVFERSRPSCYASELFGEIAGQAAGNIVLAGFGGEGACLATALDAHHRGHTFTFLEDASASRGLERTSAPDVHRVVSEIIGQYGEVMATRAWMTLMSRSQKRRQREL